MALDSRVADGQQLGPEPGSTAGLWGMGCASNSSRGGICFWSGPPGDAVELRYSCTAGKQMWSIFSAVLYMVDGAGRGRVAGGVWWL